RVADIWRSDALKEMRTLLAKAGPQALRALDERFVPALSSLDRLTIVVSAPGPREPAIGFYVTMSKPFDKEKVVGKSLADSEEEKVGALAFHVNRRLNTAVAVVDERTLLLGPANSVRAFLDKPSNANGPLQEAAKLATANAPVAIGVSVGSLPDIPRDRIPPQLVALLSAKLLTATVEFGKEPRVNLSLQFASADEAIEGEKAARAGIAMAREGLASARPQLEAMVTGKHDDKSGSFSELPEAMGGVFALAMVQSYDDLLREFPLK